MQGGFLGGRGGRRRGGLGAGRGGRRKGGFGGGRGGRRRALSAGGEVRRGAREGKFFLLCSLGFELWLEIGCVGRSAGWRWERALKPRIRIMWTVGSRGVWLD